MKHHPYGNVDPFANPESADKLLTEYFAIAERLNIQTFLYYGTVLGFVRDGGYIEADNDIDVGILSGLPELTAALVNSGFIHVVTVEKNSHFLKYGILLDIYFIFSSHSFLQSFDQVVYKGRSYNVPHPVHEYLKSRYGDWRIVKHREVYKP